MEHTGDTTQFPTLDQQMDPRFFIQYLDAGNALADVKRLKQVILALMGWHHRGAAGCQPRLSLRVLQEQER